MTFYKINEINIIVSCLHNLTESNRRAQDAPRSETSIGLRVHPAPSPVHLGEHEICVWHHSSRRVGQGLPKELTNHWPHRAVAVRGGCDFLEVWIESYMAVGIFVAVRECDAGSISLETLDVVVCGVCDGNEAVVQVGSADDWSVDRVGVTNILAQTQLQRNGCKLIKLRQNYVGLRSVALSHTHQERRLVREHRL